LESVCGGNSTAGSNPALSAKFALASGQNMGRVVPWPVRVAWEAERAGESRRREGGWVVLGGAGLTARRWGWVARRGLQGQGTWQRAGVGGCASGSSEAAGSSRHRALSAKFAHGSPPNRSFDVTWFGDGACGRRGLLGPECVGVIQERGVGSREPGSRATVPSEPRQARKGAAIRRIDRVPRFPRAPCFPRLRRQQPSRRVGTDRGAGMRVAPGLAAECAARGARLVAGIAG
jgi:hypothetical protein